MKSNITTSSFVLLLVRLVFFISILPEISSSSENVLVPHDQDAPETVPFHDFKGRPAYDCVHYNSPSDYVYENRSKFSHSHYENASEYAKCKSTRRCPSYARTEYYRSFSEDLPHTDRVLRGRWYVIFICARRERKFLPWLPQKSHKQIDNTPRTRTPKQVQDRHSNELERHDLQYSYR